MLQYCSAAVVHPPTLCNNALAPSTRLRPRSSLRLSDECVSAAKATPRCAAHALIKRKPPRSGRGRAAPASAAASTPALGTPASAGRTAAPASPSPARKPLEPSASASSWRQTRTIENVHHLHAHATVVVHHAPLSAWRQHRQYHVPLRGGGRRRNSGSSSMGGRGCMAVGLPRWRQASRCGASQRAAR